MPPRELAALVALSLAVTPVMAAVRGEKVAYVGGTADIPKGKQGNLSLTSQYDMVFRYQGGSLTVPFKSIKTLESGQKVGRRVGATIALGVTTLGLMALPLLFSKKKKHFLTIGFVDQQGAGNAIIFELSKDISQATEATLAARTGLKVEDADADDSKQTKVVVNMAPSVNPAVAARPPATAPKPEPATLTITSTPPGADIELDGKHIGNAPSTVKVQPGSHGITMRKSGHQPWGKTLDVQGDASITVAAELVAIKESPSVITIQPRAKQ